jgi:uncharacterized protein
VQIIYNNVDITASVHPLTLKLTDNAGGKPDSITAAFADSQGLWSKWKPKKGDSLQVKSDGYDSGAMYIDQLVQRAGEFEIKALSIPQTAKSARSQGWEEVRFLEIATEIAARHGFSIQTYNITNHLYERVDQIEDADFAFLARRCELEGYSLKLNDRSMVIYDERTEEQKPVQAAAITLSDMIGGFEFSDTSIGIYSKAIIRSSTSSGYIEGEFSDSHLIAPTLKMNLYASSISEAQRWAKGALRSSNKGMITGLFNINLNPKLAAGTSVNVVDVGLFDGKYFIHRLVHDLINSRTHITVRKPLEGY